jgi:hypothetical protein
MAVIGLKRRKGRTTGVSSLLKGDEFRGMIAGGVEEDAFGHCF